MKKEKKEDVFLYCNIASDFTAKVIPGTRRVKIEGLSFTLEAKHVIRGNTVRVWVNKYWIKEFNKAKKEVISVNHITIDGMEIHFGGIKKFRKKDDIILVLMGPNKTY